MQDLQEDGQAPSERRFNSPFEGPIIPSGAEVKFFATSSNDLCRAHQFGTTVLHGIFMGYAVIAGEVGLAIF